MRNGLPNTVVGWRAVMLNVGQVHPRSLIWVIWILWGFVALGIATTEVVHSSWFSTFRFWAGRIVPTVSHPPVRDVMDPVTASSFLAIVWATSPVLLFAFRRIPKEKLYSEKIWDAPLGGEALVAVGVLVLSAFLAIDYDWS